MEQIENLERYINWQKSKAIKSHIEPGWDPNDIDICWEEVIQTEEVKPGDEWNSYTTDLKHQLSRLHQSWNIPRESVRHFMSINPVLSKGLETALKPFNQCQYTYNFLKLSPGHMIVWHFDTYATFVRETGIDENSWSKINRAIVMISPWNFGQVIQIGGDILSQWKIGDIYTWNSDTWHGACNFGNSDLIVMQITFMDENETS